MSLGEESPSDNILSLLDVQLHLRSADNGTLIFSPQPYIAGLLHRDQVACSADIQRTLNETFAFFPPFLFAGCHDDDGLPGWPTKPCVRVFSRKPSRKMSGSSGTSRHPLGSASRRCWFSASGTTSSTSRAAFTRQRLHSVGWSSRSGCWDWGILQMFEHMAPTNSEGNNQKGGAGGCRAQNAIYPLSLASSGIHVWGLMVWEPHAHLAKFNIQHIKCWGFFEALQRCRWRSPLKWIAAPWVFTEKHRCHLHNLSRQYRLSQLRFSHVQVLLSSCGSCTAAHHCCQEVNRRLGGFSGATLPGVIEPFAPLVTSPLWSWNRQSVWRNTEVLKMKTVLHKYITEEKIYNWLIRETSLKRQLK